ncbi:MAG: TetR/AcrR family transcriptional regulator, partial [Sinomonas sp.]|nr:TetR/AcrR family transcriptional regulator [Sinomonas sp.]
MPGPARRRQLVDVGRGLFAAKGLDAATIEEIASAAGVTKPVIYEHFGSKEGLYRVVVEEESALLLAAITGSLAEDATPRVLVERAALALLTYIEERSGGFRILVRDAPPGQQAGALTSLLSRITVRV